MDYINKEFKHSTFGVGVVVNQMNNYITIEFPSKKSIFDTNNPDTFTKFLTAVDPAMQEAMTLPNIMAVGLALVIRSSMARELFSVATFMATI